MSANDSTNDTQQRHIELLSENLLQNEQRLRRLERSNHWLMGLLSLFLLSAAYLGVQLTAVAQEAPKPGVIQRMEQAATDYTRGFAQEVEKEKALFRESIGAIRKKVADAENFNPGHAIAVILHDMKELLAAMPHMARDMHQMTADMHEMNQKMSAVPVMATEMQTMNMKMGVMAHGVDTTMGRMGRMMPWMP